MKPAEEPDSMEAGGEDMLEEAAQQFLGRHVLVSRLAGGALAVRPADASIGEQFQGAIAGGGFENVATEVSDRRRQGRWSAQGAYDLRPGVERRSGAAVRSTDFVRRLVSHVSLSLL